LNVAVKEWDDQVVFLHQIVPGAADKSYGIHVAQLAGVPRAVNDRAREVLEWLEAQHEAADGVATSKPFAAREVEGAPPAGRSAKPRRTNGSAGASPSHNVATTHWQMTLFGYEEHPLLEEVRAADLDGLNADEALNLIRDWQQRLTTGLVPAKR
jgi:DNA mismatch repair protein MutS